MRYTTLGRRTGLRVSELALGTANFGTTWPTGADRDAVKQIFEGYAEAGGNFLDCADVYQFGEAETLLGELLAGDRDHFVVATKFTQGARARAHLMETGNSRKTLRNALHGSLRRLRTDHLDLYWVHWPDTVTPVEEIVQTCEALVEQGTILHWGLSNFPAWRVSRAATLTEARHSSGLVGAQFEYSLAIRDGERDLLPMTEALGLGAVLYSPLGGGLLTGKYRHGPEGRMSTLRTIVQREDTPQRTAVVDTLLAVAEETGEPPGRVATAWLLRRADRSATAVVPIIGPRTPDQLTDYLAALRMPLTDEQYARLDTVSAPVLGIPHDGSRHITNILLGRLGNDFRRPSPLA